MSPFTTQLSLGSNGPDVQRLQQWLNNNGYPVAQAGQPGGPGSETSYFGPATEAALQKFQAAQGIVSNGNPPTTGYGRFGPQTMAAMNQAITSGSSNSSNNGSSQFSDTGGSSGSPDTGGAWFTPTHSPITSATGAPVFTSGGHFVNFSGDGATPEQLWYLNVDTKQLFPVNTPQAAMALAGGATMDQVNNAITTLPSAALNHGGMLEGYQELGNQYAITDTGALPANPPPSNANIAARYNQQIDPNQEMSSVTALDGFMNLLKSGPGAATGSQVTPATVSSIMNDSNKMAFYINALAYGGYSLGQVYQDMLATQLQQNGQGAQVANGAPISASVPASQYANTQQGHDAATNSALQVPATIGTLDNNTLDMPIFQLPQSFFTQLAPTSVLADPNSPQFQQAMEQYKNATYEAAMQVAQAQTETAHTGAVNDWNNLKTEIQQRLGITLGDNAVAAWNQLNNFQQQASMNNLAGSGMVDQQVDSFLRQQMGVNQQMRGYFNTYQDQMEQNYYANFASPNEIKALIASDPQKAQAYGLATPDAVKNYLTLGNLQSLFPNEPTSHLQDIINQYLDPNGNMYSKLYSQNAQNQYATKSGEQQLEATAATQKSQNDLTAQLQNYTIDPNNPFLRGNQTLTPPTIPSDSTAPTKLSKANLTAAGNLGSSSSGSTGTTGSTGTGSKGSTTPFFSPSRNPNYQPSGSSGPPTTPLPKPQTSTPTGSSNFMAKPPTPGLGSYSNLFPSTQGGGISGAGITLPTNTTPKPSPTSSLTINGQQPSYTISGSNGLNTGFNQPFGGTNAGASSPQLTGQSTNSSWLRSAANAIGSGAKALFNWL